MDCTELGWSRLCHAFSIVLSGPSCNAKRNRLFLPSSDCLIRQWYLVWGLCLVSLFNRYISFTKLKIKEIRIAVVMQILRDYVGSQDKGLWRVEAIYGFLLHCRGRICLYFTLEISFLLLKIVSEYGTICITVERLV